MVTIKNRINFTKILYFSALTKFTENVIVTSIFIRLLNINYVKNYHDLILVYV